MQAALAIVALLLIGIGLRRVLAGYPDPDFAPKALTRRELALLAAASDAVYPAGGAIPESGTEAGIPQHTDRYVDAVTGRTRGLMRMLFFLVEHATLLLPAPGPRGWRRFSSLSESQRVAALEGWRQSRLVARRLVFTSLRAILAMGYFASPPVLRRLRLAPPAMETPVVEADLLYPRVGERRDSIRFTPSDLTPAGSAPPLDLDGPLHPDYAGPAE